jgi:hypothetical protein
MAEWQQRWTVGAWREATLTGRPAASEEFVKRLEVERGRRLRPQKPGPPGKSEVDVRQMSLIAR